jgi:hypothetical protein
LQQTFATRKPLIGQRQKGILSGLFTVRALLHSSDSMAWSFGGRKWGRKTDSAEHDPRKALAYSAQVEALIGQPSFVQPQLFEWWCDESLVNADWSLAS